MDIDGIIRRAENPDNYADVDSLVYELFSLVNYLAKEVKKLQEGRHDD